MSSSERAMAVPWQQLMHLCSKQTFLPGVGDEVESLGAGSANRNLVSWSDVLP